MRTTARFIASEHSSDGATFSFFYGDFHIHLGKRNLRVIWSEHSTFLESVPVKVNPGGPAPEDLEGKVAVVALKRGASVDAAVRSIAKWKPAAVLLVQIAPIDGPELHIRLDETGAQPSFTILRVSSRELFQVVDAAKPGVMEAILSLRIQPRSERMVNLKNVAGILPGTDPKLADSFVLVTAHYDHIGMNPAGVADRIYNGANDDASGVAALIEIAHAITAAHSAPRRSILFMAYFGEEKGLLGSGYYARHPLVPLNKTVADLNLEQLGRTDGDFPAGNLTLTGFDFSDVTTALRLAAAATGVQVRDPGKDGDEFFARSDNQSLADQGIPAHTIAAEFEFPDYHKVGDEWRKIDYTNMERVTRTVALTVLSVADSSEPPHWNEADQKTEKYVRAHRELRESKSAN